jgi:hypothetical protein
LWVLRFALAYSPASVSPQDVGASIIRNDS